MSRPHHVLTERDIHVLHIAASLLDDLPGQRIGVDDVALFARLSPAEVRYSLYKLNARGLVVFGVEPLRVIELIYEPDSAMWWGL